MDFSAYDNSIREIIEEIQQAMPLPGNRVFTLLRKLEKMASETDDALRGFICYSYANAYNNKEKHEPFVRYLMRAIGFLLHTDEREMLARAYNLFAVEAQKNGCFDVAYNYFSMGRSFVEQEPKSLAYGMIEGNTGDLLMEMGEYRTAARYIRKSYPIVNSHMENVLRPQYRMLILCNLGFCMLAAGDYAAAEKILRRIERSIDKAGEAPDDMGRLAYIAFRARMAIESGNQVQIDAYTDDVIRQIVETPLFGEYMKETQMICQALILTRQWKAAGRLLAAISSSEVSGSSAYAAVRFVQLEIDYYTVTGDRKRAQKCYARRHALQQRQLEIQQMFYTESIRLMLLVEDLRREQERTREENRILRQYAETDALTNLPNRYALGRHLDEVFRRAYETGGRLCIGIADIDDFKSFNDRHGHARGDDCLVQVGGELSAVAGACGMFVARYGGDEFVLVGEGMDESVRQKIESGLRDRVDVNLSFGMYSFIPDEQTRIWDCLAEADRRMYREKRAGA